MTTQTGYYHHMQRIIGESTSLAEALNHVSLVASLNRPILVVGERGSGKELIAERLHYLSRRWDKIFDKVNCAAISEPLLDTELFGHEAGAFTGATKLTLGRFERANGGTLLLDELGTMPLRIQEKLLRLIEYGEFERVGGQKTLKVDVRIVGATNENLPLMAKEGRFRHDLLDRLAFDVIQVPPLRKRQEDIPVLADHFANRMSHELGLSYFSGFGHEAMNELLEYSWPGNIRELKNVVERSLCRWGDIDNPIDTIILNPFIETDTDTDTGIEELAAPTPPALHAFDFTELTCRYEVSLIQKALAACQHHQKHTSEFMGISYHQLRALLKKYKPVIN